jgi:hypothetical protein
MSTNAITDTCMFLLGMCVGISLGFIFYKLDLETTHFSWVLLFGICQILINAFIIRFMNGKMVNIGLFTLGLIASQDIILVRFYKTRKMI